MNTTNKSSMKEQNGKRELSDESLCMISGGTSGMYSSGGTKDSTDSFSTRFGEILSTLNVLSDNTK